MKKKLLLTFVGTYLASLGLMVAGDDLVKGYDFTGSSSVTAAKLNQLVDNATPATYRGLVFYTNQAPSASYYKYLWLDPSTAIPGLKVYSTNGGGWSNIIASVSFSQNSIAAGVLQQNAVSTTNIVDNGVSSIKIAAGAVTSSKLGLQAVDATNIVNNTITSAQIATNGLATANYADASVTATKLAAGSVGTSNLQSGFLLYGTNIANGTITSANIAASGVALTNIDMTAGSANQVLRVNPSGTALQWALPTYTNATAVVDGSTVPSSGDSVRNLAHTLAVRPKLVRVVIVCTTDDSAATGFVLDDEIDLNSVYNAAALRPFTFGYDATNVIVGWTDSFNDVGALYVTHKTTGAKSTLTHANWKFKAYTAN